MSISRRIPQAKNIRLKLGGLLAVSNHYAVFIVIALLIYAVTRQNVWDEYTINNDASQHLIWLKNPAGFHPTDQTIGFSALIQPPLFKLTHSFLANFLSLHQAVVLLDVLRTILLFFFSASIVRHYCKNKIMQFLFFASLFILSINMWGIGMPRSFGVLFVLWFLYAEIQEGKKKYFLHAVNFILAAAMYPVAFLLISVLFVILRLNQWQQLFKSLKRWQYVPILGMLMGLTIAYWNSNRITASPLGGKSIDREFILNSQHTSLDGRVPLAKFVQRPVISFFESGAEAISKYLPYQVNFSRAFYLVIIALIMIAITSFIVITKRYEPFALIISGTLLYAISIVLIFRLYIPDRFIALSFYVGIIYWLIAGYKFYRHKLAIKGIVVLVLLSSINTGLALNEMNYRKQEPLYTKIAELVPEGSMIATNDLLTADMIPYFSNRSVVMNYESLHGFYFEDNRAYLEKRMAQLTSLLTTSNATELSQFLTEIPIDYLLLKEPFFEIHTKKLPEPYLSALRSAKPGLLFTLIENAKFEEVKADGITYRLYNISALKQVNMARLEN